MKSLSHQNRSFQRSWRIRAAWLAVFYVTVICGALTAQAFTSADADTLLKAHTKAFYQEKDGRAWFKESTDGGKVSYWMRAEQMEMFCPLPERRATVAVSTELG